MSRRFYLRRGLEFEWRGRYFVIDRLDENDKLQIRNTSSLEYLSVSRFDLIIAHDKGELKFIDRAGSQLEPAQRVDDLSLLPEEKYKKVMYRWHYVKAWQKAGQPCLTKAALDPIIQAAAAEINDTKPPSWITLYRWIRGYKNSGDDMRALIERFRKGNTVRKFGKSPNSTFSSHEKALAAETARIVEEVIAENYLNPQRLSVPGTCDLLKARLWVINAHRTHENKLPIPHADSIFKIVAAMDDYEKDYARFGKRYADRKYEQRGLGPRPSRPLERVEIDHTKIDLFPVDDQVYLPLGRPTLTSCVDKFSSMILGRYISFNGPGSHSVLQCLLHAIKPKTYLRELYPEIQNDWETYGLPETIACDNGLEFLGSHYATACLELGINIEYSPVKTPWYKALVERTFGTINKELLHRLPGTTFSNLFEKGDYDSKSNAIISFSALLEIFDTWIVDIFSKEIHRGYEHTGPYRIPAFTWREGIKSSPPAMPAKTEDLDILLRMIDYRTLDQGGIEIFGLRYNTPDLALVRRELKGQKIQIKYDQSDLSFIYAANPFTGTYIVVPALDQNYARGLSLYQHEIIKKYTRNYLRQQVNEESLIKAKMRVQEIVEQEFTRSKKTLPRTNAARFMKMDSVNNQKKNKNKISAAFKPNKAIAPPLLLAGVLPDKDTAAYANAGNENSDLNNDEPSVVNETGTNDTVTILPVNNNETDELTHEEYKDEEGWGGSFDLPVNPR